LMLRLRERLCGLLGAGLSRWDVNRKRWKYTVDPHNPRSNCTSAILCYRKLRKETDDKLSEARAWCERSLRDVGYPDHGHGAAGPEPGALQDFCHRCAQA